MTFITAYHSYLSWSRTSAAHQQLRMDGKIWAKWFHTECDTGESLGWIPKNAQSIIDFGTLGGLKVWSLSKFCPWPTQHSEPAGCTLLPKRESMLMGSGHERICFSKNTSGNICTTILGGTKVGSKVSGKMRDQTIHHMWFLGVHSCKTRFANWWCQTNQHPTLNATKHWGKSPSPEAEIINPISSSFINPISRTSADHVPPSKFHRIQKSRGKLYPIISMIHMLPPEKKKLPHLLGPASTPERSLWGHHLSGPLPRTTVGPSVLQRSIGKP